MIYTVTSILPLTISFVWTKFKSGVSIVWTVMISLLVGKESMSVINAKRLGILIQRLDLSEVLLVNLSQIHWQRKESKLVCPSGRRYAYQC